MIKLIKKLLLLLLCTSVFAAFSGCQAEADISDSDGTGGKAVVRFSIGGEEAQSAKILMPSATDYTSGYTYSLLCTPSSYSGSFSTTYDSYSALTAAVLTLEQDIYTFTLSVINGANVAAASSVTKTINAGNNTLSFVPESTISGGSCSIRVQFPKNSVSTVSADCITIQTAASSTLSYTTVQTDSSDYDYVLLTGVGIKKGYNKVTLTFTLSNGSTTKRIFFMCIANGETTSGTETYTDLNNKYTITYNDSTNIGYTMPSDAPQSYVASIAVTLKEPNAVSGCYFDGWYESADFSGSKVTGWNTYQRTGDVTLYPKFNPEYVYVDVTNGSDSNCGFSSTYPLKTISAAKNYLKSSHAKGIYLLSTVKLSSASDTNLPSGISDKSTYGNGTDAVKILRASSFTSGSMFQISGTGITISDVIIDGNSESAAGSGIVVDAGYDLILDGGVTIQNCINTDNSYGGAFTLSGTLTCGSASDSSKKTVITGNSTTAKGGGIYVGSSGSAVLYNTTISGNSATSGGGGVYIASNAGVSATVFSGSEISGNTSGSGGGGIYVGSSSTAVLNNTNLYKNESTKGSGGAVYNDSSFKMTGGSIYGNTSSDNGGGITVTQNSNQTDYSYISGVEMYDNACGSGTSKDGCDIYLNTASYFTINKSILRSSSGDGKYNIYNCGTLYASGKSYLGKLYANKTNRGDIYPRNFFATSDSGKVSDSTTALSANTAYSSYVAAVTVSSWPAAVYDASASSTYVTLLKAETAGDFDGLTGLFSLSSASHYLDTDGLVKLKTQSVSGTISLNDGSGYTVTADTLSVTSGSSGTITFSLKDGSSSAVNADSWTVTVYGTNGNSVASSSVTASSTASVEIVASSYPSGSQLTAVAVFTISGVSHTATFTVNIE